MKLLDLLRVALITVLVLVIIHLAAAIGVVVITILAVLFAAWELLKSTWSTLHSEFLQWWEVIAHIGGSYVAGLGKIAAAWAKAR